MKAGRLSSSDSTSPSECHSEPIYADLGRSCFIIFPTGAHVDMLGKNLSALGCQPVHFTDDIILCLRNGHPDGLNSKKDFDVILLDTEILNNDILAKMRKLQPSAKFRFLVRNINLAQTMKDFDIDVSRICQRLGSISVQRESIIARPIQFNALYTSVVDREAGASIDQFSSAKSDRKRKANLQLAKVSNHIL